ncbi:MAG: hypothetical protein LCH46_04555 [Proteobacteria bacterium]|nr:hypothetical protein [Pseudomonadota bacterium]
MTIARMLRLLVGYVGARFLGAGVGLLSQILLARLLPQADVGAVLMAMSATAFISLFAIGGQSLLASTELPRILAHGSERRMKAFLGTTLRDATYALFLLSALVGFAVWLLPIATNVKLALVFGLAAAPASGLMRFNAMVANSYKRFTLSYLPDFLVRPGLFLIALLLFWFLGWQLGDATVLWIYVLIGMAVTLGQALLLGNLGLVPAHWRKVEPRYAALVRRRSGALVLVSAVSLAFADIVTMLAGLILPAEEVALVGIAMRLAAIAGFVLQATQLFVLPDFTAAVTKQDDAAATAILWKMNSMTLIVVAAGLLGAIILGHWVLLIFGEDYAAAAPLLVLFMIGQSIRALGGMNQSLLSIHGQQLRTTGACLVALAVLVVLSIVLGGRFGPIGFGYAVIVAEVTWLLALALQASSLLGRRGDLAWLLMNRREKPVDKRAGSS